MDRRGFLTLGLQSAFMAAAVTTGLGRVSLTGRSPMTLADYARAQDNSSMWLVSWDENSVSQIIERLNEDNELLKELPFKPVDGEKLRTTIRVGLPDKAWLSTQKWKLS